MPAIVPKAMAMQEENPVSDTWLAPQLLQAFPFRYFPAMHRLLLFISNLSPGNKPDVNGVEESPEQYTLPVQAVHWESSSHFSPAIQAVKVLPEHASPTGHLLQKNSEVVGVYVGEAQAVLIP